MDIIANAWKNLMRRKMKFLLTLVGIVIGIISVVIISGIGDIGKHQVNQELNSMGVGGILISANKNGDTVNLHEKELECIKQMDEVAQISPLIVNYSKIKVKKTINSGAVIWGIDEDTDNIISIDMLYGRMINKSDINSSSNVCVIDEAFAQKHYKRSNIVGKTIDLYFNNIYQEFEIIGVTKSGGDVLQNLMGNIVPTFAYVPYTSAQMLSLDNNINQMVVKLKNDVDEKSFEKSVSITMDTQTGYSNSVVVDNINSQIDKLNNVLDMVSIILTLIGGISLVVSGLSIMTIMLVSVNERTREIGIKKAIGATQKDIIIEFISESVLITIIGGFVGILVGVLVIYLGCILIGISVIINYIHLFFILFFVVMIGVVFGVYPAYKASKLKPVDALRFE